MEIEVKSDGDGCYVITAPRELEWRARVDLVQAVQNVTQDQPPRLLILDLDGVCYMNSAALGAILTLRKYASQSGAAMVVARPSVTVNRLFTTLNLSALIPIAASMDEARRKLVHAA